VIVVVVAGLLLSFTRQFSPLRAAQQLGRIGGWMTHEEDLELGRAPRRQPERPADSSSAAAGPVEAGAAAGAARWRRQPI